LVDRAEVAFLQVGFRVVRLAVGAVEPPVDALVDVALVVQLLEDVLHPLLVPFLGGADEVVVADVEGLPKFLDPRDDLVDVLERLLARLAGRPLHVEPVLIGARQKPRVVAPQAVIARQRVGGHRRIRVPDVQLVVGIIDGRRDVERALRHEPVPSLLVVTPRLAASPRRSRRQGPSGQKITPPRPHGPAGAKGGLSRYHPGSATPHGRRPRQVLPVKPGPYPGAVTGAAAACRQPPGLAYWRRALRSGRWRAALGGLLQGHLQRNLRRRLPPSPALWGRRTSAYSSLSSHLTALIAFNSSRAGQGCQRPAELKADSGPAAAPGCPYSRSITCSMSGSSM